MGLWSGVNVVIVEPGRAKLLLARLFRPLFYILGIVAVVYLYFFKKKRGSVLGISSVSPKLVPDNVLDLRTHIYI